MTRIAVLIPAHNESLRVGETVTAALGIAQVTEVIVIDDASTDDTADLASRAGAEVVRLETNAGKGGALDVGLATLESRSGRPDIVLLLDGDLGESAAQGSLLLAPVLDGAADMAIARFPRPAGKAGFGFVLRLARWGIRRLGGPFDATAPLSGQRALNRSALEVCTPFATGYGVEVALTVRALRAGLFLTEVETTMSHAATGRDLAGFLHRGRQFVHVCRTLVALAREGRGTPPTSARRS